MARSNQSRGPHWLVSNYNYGGRRRGFLAKRHGWGNQPTAITPLLLEDKERRAIIKNLLITCVHVESLCKVIPSLNHPLLVPAKVRSIMIVYFCTHPELCSRWTGRGVKLSPIKGAERVLVRFKESPEKRNKLKRRTTDQPPGDNDSAIVC